MMNVAVFQFRDTQVCAAARHGHPGYFAESERLQLAFNCNKRDTLSFLESVVFGIERRRYSVDAICEHYSKACHGKTERNNFTQLLAVQSDPAACNVLLVCNGGEDWTTGLALPTLCYSYKHSFPVLRALEVIVLVVVDISNWIP